jgi:hypothetical protein
VHSNRIGQFNIASVHRISLDLQDAIGAESFIRKKVKSCGVANQRCSARMKGGGAEAQKAQHSLRNRSCTFSFSFGPPGSPKTGSKPQGQLPPYLYETRTGKPVITNRHASRLEVVEPRLLQWFGLIGLTTSKKNGQRQAFGGQGCCCERSEGQSGGCCCERKGR